MDTGSGPTTVAARAATLMAYVVALFGAGTATLMLRIGDLLPAVLVLTTTLGVAALLAATATLLRGLGAVERRLDRIEDELRSAPR